VTSEEVGTATRAELQEYLEGRGFAVYESEHTEELREAAAQDIELVERGEEGLEEGPTRCFHCEDGVLQEPDSYEGVDNYARCDSCGSTFPHPRDRCSICGEDYRYCSCGDDEEE
jgi:hypothetical protein